MKCGKWKYIGILVCLLVCVMIAAFPANAATVDADVADSNKIIFEDGSYIVDELSVTESGNTGIDLMSTVKNKTATRTYTYYNVLNQKCWTFSLTAKFQYDGSSAKATSAFTSYTTYVSGWKYLSRSASCSGNAAKATAVFEYLTKSVNVTIGLKCSSTGVVSNVNY